VDGAGHVLPEQSIFQFGTGRNRRQVLYLTSRFLPAGFRVALGKLDDVSPRASNRSDISAMPLIGTNQPGLPIPKLVFYQCQLFQQSFALLWGCAEFKSASTLLTPAFCSFSA
jgi:hypothetical protein